LLIFLSFKPFLFKQQIVGAWAGWVSGIGFEIPFCFYFRLAHKPAMLFVFVPALGLAGLPKNH